MHLADLQVASLIAILFRNLKFDKRAEETVEGTPLRDLLNRYASNPRYSALDPKSTSTLFNSVCLRQYQDLWQNVIDVVRPKESRAVDADGQLADTAFNPPRVKLAAEAFWQPEKLLQNSASVFLVETLQRYCKTYREAWMDYLAPYTTVIGPGIGKSFAVKELSTRHNLYVVYMSLSEANSRGYPPRTALKDTIEQFSRVDFAKCVKQWELFIECLCIDAKINHEKNVSPGQYFRKQAADDKYMRLLQKDMPKARAKRDQFVLDRFTSKRRRHIHDTNQPLGATSIDSTSVLKVVICIDEARGLFRMSGGNPFIFHAFRQAIKGVSERNRGLFAILLHTTSHISKFSPAAESAEFDQSRKVPDRSQRLFEPIYSLNTFDIFAIDNNPEEYLSV